MYKVDEFDTGRNALRKLINLFNIKKMYIPYYLCDVVRHTLVEEACKPIFYHIDENFYPDKEFLVDDYILYPNYWGVCGKNVQKLVRKYPKLIVDNAHAFYDKPSGFACFNAGHKFGYKKSYLWVKENAAQMLHKCANLYVKYSAERAEERKQKFLELHNKYKELNLLNIDTDSIPFCYPCLMETVEQANSLVKNLKSEGKTIYRYWNVLPKSFLEYRFYSKLVPIPIE